MDAVIRIHHPDLTKADREYRMELIKKSTIKFFQEVQNEKKKSQNRMVKG